MVSPVCCLSRTEINCLVLSLTNTFNLAKPESIILPLQKDFCLEDIHWESTERGSKQPDWSANCSKYFKWQWKLAAVELDVELNTSLEQLNSRKHVDCTEDCKKSVCVCWTVHVFYFKLCRCITGNLRMYKAEFEVFYIIGSHILYTLTTILYLHVRHYEIMLNCSLLCTTQFPMIISKQWASNASLSSSNCFS